MGHLFFIGGEGMGLQLPASGSPEAVRDRNLSNSSISDSTNFAIQFACQEKIMR
jgi:hypothetical protein